MKKFIWLAVSVMMVISLILAACTTPASPTTPVPTTTPTTPVTPTPSTPTTEKPQQEPTPSAAESPKYGGSLRLPLTADITNWDDVVTRTFVQGTTFLFTNESLWRGDWTKGPAGGYGTNETDWKSAYDLFAHKKGFAAENWSWRLDDQTNEGVLVWQIRQGTNFALNSKSEASKLVNGRQLTADDVLFSLQQVMTDSRSYMYRAYPSMRTAKFEKTGPWEVTIRVSKGDLITAIAKFGNYVGIVPQEVVKKYGDMAKWQNSVGSGPYMLRDYVAGSQAVLIKNPNYWGTDPIGPGKGNKLPYIDSIYFLIVPDASTRLAALRTGKLDTMTAITREDAISLRNSAPKMIEGEGGLGGNPIYVYMNTQREPFNNLKVRRAMLMSIDLVTIRDSLNYGLGQLLTWPIEYVPAYADMYLGLDDPEMPASVKELYIYNPTKAKALLTEAGFPNGFKTTALIASAEVDYFSIIKDMWAKVGIDLSLDIKEVGQRTTLYNSGNYDIVGQAGGRGPLSVFYHMVTMVGDGPRGGNASQIVDPVIQAAAAKMKEVYITDEKAAMLEFKELMKHVLDQAYVVSRPIYPQSTFWWPWLKAYSGEISVGYIDTNFWATYIWIDQDLKKSMGY